VSLARTLRLAHRGDWRHSPENSLGALVAALEIPACDGVELDVRLSRDGVPVLCHDETLDRVYRVPARVDELPVSQLADHGVATLEEILAVLPRRAFLDVELKDRHGRATVDVLIGGRGAGLERAVVSSFEPASVEQVARLAPSWRRWLNAFDLEPPTIARAVDLDCSGISVAWRAIDARAIGRARDAGLELAAWTVRRRPTYRRLEALGVVAIIAEAGALDG
jgi:glycerophosphoryl diester phosphodiesterase